MTNIEASSSPEESPLEKEAREFCGVIKQAIAVAAEYKVDPTPENKQRLEMAQQYIGELSPFGGNRFRFQLQISPSDGVYSHLSKYNQPFLDNPGPTIVDEVRAIREDELVFFIHEGEIWFVVFGHDVEIEPIFPE